jgi:hypothetical protein
MSVTLVDGGVSEWWLEAETDPNGLPVVAYMTEDGSVHVLKCRDVNCENGVDELEIGYSPGDEALEFDLALFPDGSPVVVVQSWGYDVATVHVCLDPSCTEFSVVELADPEPCAYADGRRCDFTVDFPEIAVGRDGLARVAYLTPANPTTVTIATCQDRACNGWQWSPVAQLPPDSGTGAFSFRIDDQDRAIVGYWWEQGYDVQGTVVAVCEDASCASEPQVVFEVEGGVLPVTMEGPDGSFLVWYVTGAAGLPPELVTPEAMEQGDVASSIYSDYSDLMVASCESDGCGEPQYVPPGEDWVLAFRTNLRLFTFEDGNTGALFHWESPNEPIPQFHIAVCTDPECSSGETRPLGIAADEMGYRAIDVIYSPGTPPQIVYAANGGLHFFTCSDDVCAGP